MKSYSPQPEYLDVKALAAYSSLSARTLRKIFSQPDGPAFYRLPGPGKILVKRADFDNWFSQFKRQPSDLDALINETMKELGARQ
jgi:hypothetical protein